MVLRSYKPDHGSISILARSSVNQEDPSLFSKAMSFTPPPGIDLQADQGPRVISSGIALIILPTVFVIVRFVSRFIAKAGFWWDDLLVVVSLLLSYGPNTAMMICMYSLSAG